MPTFSVPVFVWRKAGSEHDAFDFVVAGLEAGPFTEEMHDDSDRLARYRQSKLSLTMLGKAVLAQTEDFSRHNPTHRWWGGTELTNDNLWRWDAVSQALVAPLSNR